MEQGIGSGVGGGRELVEGDFDGAFEVNAARAFDEDDVAGVKVLNEPLTGGLSVI